VRHQLADMVAIERHVDKLANTEAIEYTHSRDLNLVTVPHKKTTDGLHTDHTARMLQPVTSVRLSTLGSDEKSYQLSDRPNIWL
jgi:hypothetical protein